MTDARKVFVLDTSVLIHDDNAIQRFGDNILVIPFPVLEELDKHKQRGDNGTAFAARQVIRLLDKLSADRQIDRGVEIPETGGILIVDGNKGEAPKKGVHLDTSINDNFILSVAMKWQTAHDRAVKEGRGSPTHKWADPSDEICHRLQPRGVFVIAKDFNLRVKARALNLVAKDYFGDHATEKRDRLYSGIAEIIVESSSLQELSSLLNQRTCTLSCNEIAEFVDLPELFPNQCCIFSDGKGKTALAVYKEHESGNSFFRHVKKPVASAPVAGIRPLNVHQAFAYDLLVDPTIQIVTLTGIAGSGKTLMALLAGLNQLQTGDYEGMRELRRATEIYKQILVYRSNIEIGEPLGFQPGNIEEKFSKWARPIHDVLELLQDGEEKPPNDGKKGKEEAHYDIKKLVGEVKAGEPKILIEPINFIRGRSFHKKFVVVDETQNFKPGDIKKVITRVGKGTKIVLTGDVEQIDNLYLDERSNGLTHVIERMKGQELFGHITLEGSLRSRLAEIAATLL
jgi:PhoH-like ATPase